MREAGTPLSAAWWRTLWIFSRMQKWAECELILKEDRSFSAELDEAVNTFTDRARTEHKNLILR